MKEMDELADLELKKNDYEKELEDSLDEIEKMSELLKKLKRVEITECKQIEAERKIDNTNHPSINIRKGSPKHKLVKSKTSTN